MAKFKVCLTGGIASGKTYVSNKLAALGMYIIDADVLARKVVVKGSEGLNQLVTHFGSSILDETNCLDRAKLKQIVFGSQANLKALNAITHPLIKAAFNQASSMNSSAPEVWVVPLLDGQSGYVDFDRVIVVDAKVENQLSRISKRDHITIQKAQSIIDSQPTRKTRLKLASDVITNHKDFDSLDQNVICLSQILNQLIKRSA